MIRDRKISALVRVGEEVLTQHSLEINKAHLPQSLIEFLKCFIKSILSVSPFTSYIVKDNPRDERERRIEAVGRNPEVVQ